MAWLSHKCKYKLNIRRTQGFDLKKLFCPCICLCKEAAWPSGQRVGLAIRRSRVRVPLRPLAGFVLGRPELKFIILGHSCK